MKKTLTSLFLLFSICIIAQDDFKFEFDYAQFAYDSTSNYVEIYYSFLQNNLTLQSENNESYNTYRRHHK